MRTSQNSVKWKSNFRESPECELRRILFPRNTVNKAYREEKGPGRSIGPGPFCFSASVSHSLGTPLLFKARNHQIGGLGRHVRLHRAIGGDVIIVARTIRIGARACAIRLDSIGTGESLLTNLPIHVSCSDAFGVAV